MSCFDAEMGKDEETPPDARICPQDGSVCWEPGCDVSYCRGVADGKALASSPAAPQETTAALASRDVAPSVSYCETCRCLVPDPEFHQQHGHVIVPSPARPTPMSDRRRARSEGL